MVLSTIDSDRSDIAQGILYGIAALAGFGGLMTGGIVLVVQLTKGKVHLKNALYFLGAWVTSVLVFLGAIVINV